MVRGVHITACCSLSLPHHDTCSVREEMLELSKHGQNRNVDMTVGDIYGKDYAKIGLDSSVIASSMAKSFREDLHHGSEPPFSEADIAASVLVMIRCACSLLVTLALSLDTPLLA